METSRGCKRDFGLVHRKIKTERKVTPPEHFQWKNPRKEKKTHHMTLHFRGEGRKLAGHSSQAPKKGRPPLEIASPRTRGGFQQRGEKSRVETKSQEGVRKQEAKIKEVFGAVVVKKKKRVMWNKNKGWGKTKGCHVGNQVGCETGPFQEKKKKRREGQRRKNTRKRFGH